MPRVPGRIIGVLIVLVAIGGLDAYDLVTRFDEPPVTDDAWALDGAGGDFVVMRAWQEATGSVQAVDVPRASRKDGSG